MTTSKDFAETLSAYATAIQGVVISVGVVVGGAWTWKLYEALLQREQAVLATQKLRLEAEESERALRQSQEDENSIVVNAEIDSRQLELEGILAVACDVKLWNTGRRDIRLNYDSSSLEWYIARVANIDQDGKVTYEPDRRDFKTSYFGKRVANSTLRAGAAPAVLSAVQTVPGPGLYLVRFSQAASDGTPNRYAAQKFIVVQDSTAGRGRR